MKYFVLTKIGTKVPLFFGKCWFILSIILTLGQFYDLYIKSLCISQTFKIRKLVSTRFKLLDEQKNENFSYESFHLYENQNNQ